mmetsp:Transcript_27918/g.59317  ORF Transcript_27918/g.59317 Transcript_27918/m.59317 type:complete len:304 (-) Transcript_27918:1497-2408(-)
MGSARISICCTNSPAATSSSMSTNPVSFSWRRNAISSPSTCISSATAAARAKGLNALNTLLVRATALTGAAAASIRSTTLASCSLLGSGALTTPLPPSAACRARNPRRAPSSSIPPAAGRSLSLLRFRAARRQTSAAAAGSARSASPPSAMAASMASAASMWSNTSAAMSVAAAAARSAGPRVAAPSAVWSMNLVHSSASTSRTVRRVWATLTALEASSTAILRSPGTSAMACLFEANRLARETCELEWITKERSSTLYSIPTTTSSFSHPSATSERWAQALSGPSPVIFLWFVRSIPTEPRR